MNVPKYYEFYNVFLDALHDGNVVEYNSCKEYIKQKCQLTEPQLSVQSKSGGSVWENRVGWCATYLKNAGLVISPKRAAYQITKEGLSLLSEDVTITDDLLCERYPSFLAFKQRKLDAKLSKKRVKIVKPDEYLIKLEALEDEHLLEHLQNEIVLEEHPDFSLNGIPREKADPIIVQGRKIFPRNRDVAFHALSCAHFSCEIDPNHLTFHRKRTNYPYTEPHHLIPMAYQDQFDVSLDVEENIVSLCCTCHKEIHYGSNAKIIAKRLYAKRKTALKSVGIKITEKQLECMYD